MPKKVVDANNKKVGELLNFNDAPVFVEIVVEGEKYVVSVHADRFESTRLDSEYLFYAVDDCGTAPAHGSPVYLSLEPEDESGILFKNGVWVSEEDSPLKGTMFAAQNVEPAIVAVRSKGVFESGACTADIRDISCVPVVPIVNLLSIFTPPFRITD